MTVHPFVQSAVDRIPVYGTPRTAIAVGSLLIETYMKYNDKSRENNNQRYVFNAQVNMLRTVQILSLLGATRIFSSKLISIPVSVALIALCIPKIQLGFDFLTGAKTINVDSGRVMQDPNRPSCTPIINNALLYGGFCTKVVNIFAVGLFASKLFSEKPISAVASGVSAMAVAYLTLYNGFKDFDL
ncbi:MAG: hypothetical protein ABSA17_03365 [Rhabdochlamydiaceae bacterium]|jgi:hypothetical protein